MFMSIGHFIQGFAQPLTAWSITHRLCVAVSVATFTFAMGMHFWAVAKMANIAVHHSVIDKLAARVQAATATLATLPTMRQRAAALRLATEGNALVDDASLLHTLTAMVAASNLRLDAFEPGQPTAEPHWREHRLQLLVTGEFTDLVDFTAQLAALPYPIVPIAAQLKSSALSTQTQKNAQKQADYAHALSLNMSLRVIGVNTRINAQAGHPPSNLLTKHNQGTLHNPFKAWNTALIPILITTLPPATLQLVGILQRGPVRAALIQSPAGFSLLHVGDVLDGKTVTRIDPTSLSLSSNGQTHTLLLPQLQEASPETRP